MNGFFYIPRGVDPRKNARIEEDCAFAVIQPETLIEKVEKKSKEDEKSAKAKSLQKGEETPTAKEGKQQRNVAESNVLVDSSMIPVSSSSSSSVSSSPSAFNWKAPRASLWLFVYLFICVLFVYLLLRSRPLLFLAYDGSNLPRYVSSLPMATVVRQSKEDRHGKIQFTNQSIQFDPPTPNSANRHHAGSVEEVDSGPTVSEHAESRVPLLSSTKSYGSI
jgi:hypothetical protein